MLTKAGLRCMYIGGLNGHPIKCTIKRRCYTHVFKFPRIFLQAETKVAPLLRGLAIFICLFREYLIVPLPMETVTLHR